MNAVVARELAGQGATLNPGESIRYVITEYQAALASDRARAWEFMDGSWAYDVDRYTELLLRAVETLFVPFGVTASMLRNWLVKEYRPSTCGGGCKPKARGPSGASHHD